MPRRSLALLHACAIAFLARSAVAQAPPNDPAPAAPVTMGPQAASNPGAPPGWGAPSIPSPPGAPSSPPSWSPAAARPWSSVDPLVPAGIMVVTAGVGFAIPGFFALGAQGESVCGLNGCVTAPNYEARARASGLLGASGAMLLVGLPTLIMGASGSSPEAGERRSPRGAMAGAWLTGFGAGAVAYGLGTAFAAGNTGKVEGVGVAIGIGAVGLAMMAAGIPLWAVGTRRVPLRERTADSMRPARGETRMNVGLTLSSVGIVTTGVGAMTMANLAAARGDFAGFGVILIGLPILVAGTACLGVGLPLWLTGAGPKTDATALLPSFDAGPGGVRLTWKTQ